MPRIFTLGSALAPSAGMHQTRHHGAQAYPTQQVAGREPRPAFVADVGFVRRVGRLRQRRGVGGCIGPHILQPHVFQNGDQVVDRTG